MGMLNVSSDRAEIHVYCVPSDHRWRALDALGVIWWAGKHQGSIANTPENMRAVRKIARSFHGRYGKIPARPVDRLRHLAEEAAPDVPGIMYFDHKGDWHTYIELAIGQDETLHIMSADQGHEGEGPHTCTMTRRQVRNLISVLEDVCAVLGDSDD